MSLHNFTLFDDKFDTTKQGADIESLWQHEAGMPDQLSDTVSVDIPHQRFKQDWVMESLQPEPISITPTPASAESTNVDNNNPQAPAIVEDEEAPERPPQATSPQRDQQVSRIDHSQPRRSKRLAKPNKPRRSARIASQVHP